MKREIESWQLLVHVCRRWRGLVFKSPRRLNLQLCCYTPRISAKETLDLWSALPLLILGGVSDDSLDDAVADLQHSDRISQINLECHRTSLNPMYDSPSKKLWTAMQVPFPGARSSAPVSWNPDRIQGRASPSRFILGWVCPTSTVLVLGCNSISGITEITFVCHSSPPSSPSRYSSFWVHFTRGDGHLPLHVNQPRNISTRIRIPSILSRPRTPMSISANSLCPPHSHNFFVQRCQRILGTICVARIDALNSTAYRHTLTFFSNIDFKAPELNQFIRRTPTLGEYEEARVIVLKEAVLVRLRPFRPEAASRKVVEVKSYCSASDRKRATLTQICTLSLHRLLTMEDLYIDGLPSSPLVWDDDIENTKWLDLLLPFIAVKNLYLSQPFSLRIALALEELTGGGGGVARSAKCSLGGVRVPVGGTCPERHCAVHFCATAHQSPCRHFGLA